MTANNPFETKNGKEIFNSEILPTDTNDLPFFCIVVALKYGIDKVEAAIKNTYHITTANDIISKMNKVLAS